MAPMRKPAPPQHEPWQSTMSIDAYARARGMQRREVKQLLATGQLPFIQLAGQIRIPREALDREEVG